MKKKKNWRDNLLDLLRTISDQTWRHQEKEFEGQIFSENTEHDRYLARRMQFPK